MHPVKSRFTRSPKCAGAAYREDFAPAEADPAATLPCADSPDDQLLGINRVARGLAVGAALSLCLEVLSPALWGARDGLVISLYLVFQTTLIVILSVPPILIGGFVCGDDGSAGWALRTSLAVGFVQGLIVLGAAALLDTIGNFRLIAIPGCG